ncbi:MAG: hypothetical protein GF344_10030 [Chitinivibrionales bacterium]|nr:hypothetical protein [Chitinivibrionales bacterium]
MILVAHGAAFQPDSSTMRTIDSLYHSDGDTNWIDLVSETESVYVGASFRTFSRPYGEVKATLLDFDAYGKAFKFVREFLPLHDDSLTHLPSYHAYFELGTVLYRVWAVGAVESIDSSGDSLLQVRIAKTHDKGLTEQWRDAPKGGIIAVQADLFGLRWYCRRLGPEKTRAGFVAWLSPTVNLPRWIIRFAYRVFVPRFLEDVELRLRKKL